MSHTSQSVKSTLKLVTCCLVCISVFLCLVSCAPSNDEASIIKKLITPENKDIKFLEFRYPLRVNKNQEYNTISEDKVLINNVISILVNAKKDTSPAKYQVDFDVLLHYTDGTSYCVEVYKDNYFVLEIENGKRIYFKSYEDINNFVYTKMKKENNSATSEPPKDANPNPTPEKPKDPSTDFPTK